MTTSILIPYREQSPERSRILEWNLRRLKWLLPSAEVILGDSDPDLPFSRSAAINDAFRRSSGELLVIADSDTIFDPGVLGNCMKAVDGWRLPYTTYTLMNRRCSERILASSPTILLSEQIILPLTVLNAHPDRPFEPPASGVLAFTREDFITTGGFNEEFIGWGYEDNAFVFNAMQRLGPPTRDQGNVYHIFHPRSKNEKLGSGEAEENRARFYRYCRDYEWKDWLNA